MPGPASDSRPRVARTLSIRSRHEKTSFRRRVSSTLCPWNLRTIRCAPRIAARRHGGVPCDSRKNTSTPTGFEVTSKRRRGFPSETRVKRGKRVVGGYKELSEKLGRNDPCPCLSGRRFQE